MNANQNTITTIVIAILDPNETIFILLKGCYVKYKKNPLVQSVSYCSLERDHMRLIAKPPTDRMIPIIVQNVAVTMSSSVKL